MPDVPTRLEELRSEAEAAIAQASDAAALEELRVRYLGRRSQLTQVLRSIGELPAEERGPAGQQANEVRRALEDLIDSRTEELERADLERRLARLLSKRGLGVGRWEMGTKREALIH